ncbi:reverse transcriptase domain-containing protein [Tanacetum coccineum]
MVEGKPFNTKHKLNECSHIKPIKHNKRGLGPDRNMAACKEIEELMKARILQKVKHQTWVANPVMVKKSDGGWRMCVDFTDINKACPKDCYPLPDIDWKIESLLGFCLKCFLDAYKGYHQIQRAEEDEDKTTFYAGEGVFCYKKMSFCLKNAGATYQRLVDKVFSHQIRRNLETYIDDMVIKSTSEEEMLKDIQETFERREEKETPANFLIEIPSEDNETKEKPKEVPDSSSKWRLYTDRASNLDGSRTGLMLMNTEEKSQKRFKTAENAKNNRQFGVPLMISSKEEKHFKEGMFVNLCKGLKITQSFSPVTEHMEIMHHIEKQLTRSQQGWVDNLAKILWIQRTLPWNSKKETPFSLTYGSEAVIPIIKTTDDRGRV